MKRLLVAPLLFLAACVGESGARGPKGVGVGINTEPASSQLCSAGGIVLTTFRDFDNDNIRAGFDTIVSVNTLCNGLDGNDGVSLIVEESNTCLSGGVTIHSSTSTINICNGLNGENGIDGLSGENGSIVAPIKFCNEDTSKYPEYGLLIDDKLFAVYWGSTPASRAPQAFLTEITPGTYQSTGGNNCTFTITEDLGVVQ